MEKLILVHLSDIHFTKSSGTTVYDLDADLRNELRRDAVKVTKSVGGVTGILVTGDIAFSGQRAEYNQAADWLREFCQAIECPEESVYVVPGNHDVDRKLASAVFTEMLHAAFRSKDAQVDSLLRKYLSDAQSADALLAPLAEYNMFAARFECSISAKKPFWERDLKLSCGTIIRLRGLCSALVSNAQDERGNVVLGTAQVSVPRTDGVEYLTLCHHPPDWLCDQDEVITHLESKVRIQLFGHKHSQRVQLINERLRITAGAMHPERKERNWEPMYNIIEIARRDDERIGVRLYQRRWHKTESCFVADQDTNTGNAYRDYIWQDCPRPIHKEKHVAVASGMTRPELGGSTVVAAKTVNNGEIMPPPNHERRLTYRFLTLPFRHQIAIAHSLNVLTDEDRALSDEALFRELFKRAHERNLLAKLWKETEDRHGASVAINPFDISN